MVRGQIRRNTANVVNVTIPSTSSEHLLEAIPSTSLADSNPSGDQVDANPSTQQNNTQQLQQNQQSDPQNVLQSQAAGKALANDTSQEDLEEEDEEEANEANFNHGLQSLRQQNAMLECYKQKLLQKRAKMERAMFQRRVLLRKDSQMQLS